MAEGGVGVAFLDGAAGVDQCGGVPIGILERVQPFIQSAITIRIPIPQDQAIHIHRAPDIPRHGVRPNPRLQQLPIAAEEAVGHRGPDGIRHMPVQGIAAVGDYHHIRRILDLDDLVPSVVDEAVVVLVGGQVAVAVISRRGGAADRDDLILLVGRPGLRGAVGGDGVPVADGIVVPRLAIRG